MTTCFRKIFKETYIEISWQNVSLKRRFSQYTSALISPGSYQFHSAILYWFCYFDFQQGWSNIKREMMKKFDLNMYLISKSF